MKRMSALLIAFFLSMNLAQATDRVPNVWLAKVKVGQKNAKLHQWLDEHNFTVTKKIAALNVLVIEDEGQSNKNAQEELSGSGQFDFVEPDFLATGSSATWTPNDPYFPLQWHHATLGTATAWDSTRGSGVTVAVVDSGAETTHPDLVGRLVPGWSFVTNTADTNDTLGHGTGVAGAIGANANNGTGVAGMAPLISIMPLVALDTNGYATYSNMANSVTYAVDRGIRLINISLGGPNSSQTLQLAADYAWKKGALIFAAAMNNANSTRMYPAATKGVIAVSATNSSDRLASFSNFGDWITLSAPGEYIDTTRIGARYWFVQGTSFASPIAMSVAALALSLRPTFSNQELIDFLKTFSDDLGTPGFDPSYGYGRVNAAKAIAGLATLPLPTPTPVPDLTAPAVSITSPSSGTVVTRLNNFNVNVTATDNVGVTKVELYVDNNLRATLSSAPYTFNLSVSSLSRGTRRLKATAYDAAGNKTDSNNTTIIR